MATSENTPELDKPETMAAPTANEEHATDNIDQSEAAQDENAPQTPPTLPEGPSPQTEPPGHVSVLSDRMASGLTPNMVDIETIPKAAKNIVGNHRTMPNRENSRMRLPNQMVKVSTVQMSKPREKSQRNYYSNYVETRKPHKVITWDEATSARPPLRIDMEGPTPCSYSPRVKPFYETNAPQWSFGRKTFVEKSGGARTSWEKTWFQNPDVWTQKADFYSDKRWPAPSTHKQAHSVGSRLAALHSSPQHTFGYRRQTPGHKKEAEPSPNEYNVEKSMTLTLPKSPAFSHSLRWGGTCLWGYTETSPGPGTYKPEASYSRIKSHHPSFSIRGIRREQTHELGPFAAF